ncbi:hypothetical protein BCR33DRAFT_655225, partial [Rhizoclosmatium globosum]
GNFYEAHQMYHSVCQRLVTQQKPADAVTLLYAGAVELLNAKQIGSGSDLGLRMIDLFESEKMAVDTESRKKVLDIFQAFHERQNTYCEDFVRRSMKWSGTNGEFPTGDQQLHHAMGTRYFKEKEYYNAEHHFALGTLDSAKAMGRMAYQWSQEGYFEDAGYFIARGALALKTNRSELQISRSKKHQKAYIAYQNFLTELTENKPDDVDSDIQFNPTTGAADTLTLTKHPLSNFIALLLIIIQRDGKEEFVKLMNEYKPEVYGFDPYLAVLFERVAGIYFGLGPKKQPNPMAVSTLSSRYNIYLSTLFTGTYEDVCLSQLMSNGMRQSLEPVFVLKQNKSVLLCIRFASALFVSSTCLPATASTKIQKL